jgi:hypothetical protein
MIDLFDLEAAKRRREDLLREAQEHRIAAALRKAHGSRRGVSGQSEDVEVSWGFADEEPVLAMPHHHTFRR